MSGSDAWAGRADFLPRAVNPAWFDVMPTSRALSVLALVLVAGCAEPDIEPRAGTWSYGDVILSDNTCKGSPSTDIAGDFEVTVLGAGRFTIEADGLENPLDCSHGGGDFTCPETLLTKIAVPAVDAEFILTVDVAGTLVSSTEFTASEDIRTTCAGADCEQLIAAQDLVIPCEYTYSFSGTAK